MGYGYYQLPDVKNYRLNKYGMPSYHHIALDAGYRFQHFLKGMEVSAKEQNENDVSTWFAVDLALH
jgi:hypothetical protein